jgi:hypothetical protein
MTARTDFKVLGESAVGPNRQFAAVLPRVLHPWPNHRFHVKYSR